jgi:O-antigen ligase/Flp pilus assembly protein TadD
VEAQDRARGTREVRTRAVGTDGLTRGIPAVLGIAFLSIPLFPAFITLAPTAVPGISLLPRTATLALLLVAFAIALYCGVTLATSPREPLPTVLPLALFPIAAAVAALLGFDALRSALFIAILAGGVIWHATVLRFFRLPHVATTIYRCFLASGALAAALAVVMVVAKSPAGIYTIGHGRAIGTFILPGELAGYLIVYIPVAFALAVAPQRDLRLLARAGLIVAAIAFVLTFSRAGYAGMAAAIAFFVFMYHGRRGAGFVVALVAATIVTLGVVFNAHHDPSENFTRLSIWQAAWGIIERFPLIGVGPFEFGPMYELLRLPDGEPTALHAHSFPLTVAAEMGLIGFAAVLLGCWRVVAVFRARLRVARVRSAVAIGIAAGLVGTSVQGLVDTLSVVIFALWFPFTALALAALEDESPMVPNAAVTPRTTPRLDRRVAVVTILAALIVAGAAGFVQLASAASFARAAAPYSLVAHLPPELGSRMYGALERVAPLPFVEAMLADDALRRGDLAAAAEHAARLPAGTLRSEDEARIALARSHRDEALASFLDAGDDRALQAAASELVAAGRLRAAYDLEERIGQRLAAAKTRPNAVADSWWRLGRLAVRLNDPRAAERDYARATELAPFNTKYLIDAGMLALQEHRADAARSAFARANEIDAASADAVAGLGLAALERGDRAEAQRLAERAAQLEPRAAVVRRLQQRLQS